MIIGIPKENIPSENRVAVNPGSVKELIKTGLSVKVESGAGKGSYISDQSYIDAGADILENQVELLQISDIVLKVNHPLESEADLLKNNSIFVSLFQTTKETKIVQKLVSKKITGFSMHLIPRTTLAQKMDALSSQSNIAGYKAVLTGSTHLGVYMPLLMTAAGTIPPAKVLVLGAGVAGLQAIATAKRLGAQVEAFDVRPEVKEQVNSLGAKFVEVISESGEGVGEGGYAKETSDEYKKQQTELIKSHIAKSDMVITTALIPGRPAPILISEDMVEKMKPGSVIMDLAAENGGNCALTEKDRVVIVHDVTIDGTANISSTVPIHATQLYSKNITSFISYLFKDGELNLDLDDEIISGAMFTHNGAITHEPTKEALNR